VAQDGLPFDDPPPPTEAEREKVAFLVEHTRARLRGEERQPWTARPGDECKACGTAEAVLVKRGGQNTVRCAFCDALLYNAPKTETGERARTVETLRAGIKPSLQARILDRDNGRCAICGHDGEMQIGHLLSIEEGARLGAPTDLLNDEANLAAMCEPCNLGYSSRSVNPRMYAAIMYRLVQAEQIRRLAGTASTPPVSDPATR
jgi:hypothetical protein